MRKFIVAVASLYDNDLKQFQIEAKSEKEAIAIGMTKSQNPESNELDEGVMGMSDDLETIKEECFNADMLVSVFELK